MELAVVYLGIWGWFVPPVILMLHCTMHRPFIRKPKWLDRIHPYLMTFFFGMPTGYAQHHMGMHHVEDNMGEDLSSTLRYRRDSFLHFLVYFGRFFFLILVELTAYLLRKKRTAMARKALLGEFLHWSVPTWWEKTFLVTSLNWARTPALQAHLPPVTRLASCPIFFPWWTIPQFPRIAVKPCWAAMRSMMRVFLRSGLW